MTAIQTTREGNETLPRRGEKASSIEFWRFAFTVLVSVYHLEIYFWQRKIFLSGVSAVEFFFILAGFLLAKSAKRNVAARAERMTVREAHMIALGFVKKKLKAIYPVLIAVMLIWAVTVLTSVQIQFGAAAGSKAETLMNSEWELLLLVGTPFGFNDGLTSNIPMWFLTMLLIVGYIYTYAIYRHYDFVVFAAPVVGVLFYIFFALNAPSVIEHGTPMGFFNAGTVKAVAEMSFGIALYQLYAYISQKKLGVIWRIALSILEIYAVYRLLVLTFYQPLGVDNYRRIIYIAIIMLLSFLNVTALSRLLSNKFSRLLGRISLAMYLSHYCLVQVYFSLLGKLKMRLSIYAMESPFARAISNFLKDAGGGYGSATMTWKDMVVYLLLVIIISVLILLAIAGVKRYVIKPLMARAARRTPMADNN